MSLAQTNHAPTQQPHVDVHRTEVFGATSGCVQSEFEGWMHVWGGMGDRGLQADNFEDDARYTWPTDHGPRMLDDTSNWKRLAYFDCNCWTCSNATTWIA